MSTKKFFTVISLLVLGAWCVGVVMQYRWPHMTLAEQGAYQEFFTVSTGILGFCLVLLGTYAAFQSAEASRRQAIAADRQALAADKQAEAASAQIVLATEQIEIAKNTLKEQLRPVLDLVRMDDTRPWDHEDQGFYVVNMGAGAAKDVVFEFFKGMNIRAPQSSLGSCDDLVGSILPPNQKILLPALGMNFRAVVVFYMDISGQRYASVLRPSGTFRHFIYVEPGINPSPEKFDMHTARRDP